MGAVAHNDEKRIEEMYAVGLQSHPSLRWLTNLQVDQLRGVSRRHEQLILDAIEANFRSERT